LLLNKPVGWTSNAALQKAKWLFNATKAGHTGTLDPFASGLLPICFGQATKFSSFALHGNKTYRATAKLGITTTTGDIEGEIIETRPVNVSPQQVLYALPKLTGEIQQVPPMYSALKHQGKALYEYARQGIEIERKSRTVTIHRLKLLALENDALTLEIDCSGGTYIRTLAEDLGNILGCGAYLTALERTASGHFTLDQSIGLEALEALDSQARIALLLPPDVMISGLPKLVLDAETARLLKQGKNPNALEQASYLTEGAISRAYVADEFIGLVTQENGLLRAYRLMATNTDLQKQPG